MDNFFTWDYLATYGGMIAFVTGVTQLAKFYLPKIEPKWIALAAAFIGQLAVQIIFTKDMSAQGIGMALINVIAVLLGSIGLFETVVKPIQRAAQNSKDA